MGLIDFIDLANAQFRAEEESWDKEYQRTAWQTSLLMNATGNYGRKQIKPESLYKSPFESKADTSTTRKKNKEYVESEQQVLTAMFGL